MIIDYSACSLCIHVCGCWRGFSGNLTAGKIYRKNLLKLIIELLIVNVEIFILVSFLRFEKNIQFAK